MASYTKVGFNLDDMKLYANERIAVGVSLFFAYLIHYVFFALCTFWKSEKADRIKFLS